LATRQLLKQEDIGVRCWPY